MTHPERGQSARHPHVAGQPIDAVGERQRGLGCRGPRIGHPEARGDDGVGLRVGFGVEPHHVRQQHPVDHPVRQVQQASDLMTHRVRGAEDRVRERQPRFEGSLGHQHACRHLCGPLHGADQVVGDHLHGPQRVMVGELVVTQRHERLDAMGEGVQTGGRVEPVRHRGQQARVDDRGVGNQRAAQDGDLGVAGGVGDDAELRHVGPGPRRRRDHHERRDGHLRLVHALVVEDVATVGGQDGYPLGGVDDRSAADGDEDIAPLLGVALIAGGDLVVFRVGREIVPDDGPHTLLTQVRDHLVDPARRNQPGVGHQHGTQRTESQRGMRGLGHRVDTEHDLRRVELQQPRSDRGVGPIGLGRQRRVTRACRGGSPHVQLRHGLASSCPSRTHRM